jgi:DNA-binding beta-propeller fold protein YncE
MQCNQRVIGACLFLSYWLSAYLYAGNSNSLMDISTDGKLLACSNRDSGTVSIIALPELKKLQEVPVGKHPEGVTFLGDTHNVAVAVYSEDKICILNADAGTITQTLDVFDEPYSVISNRKGDTLYATLDFPSQILEINVVKNSIVNTIPVGAFARGLALAPHEKTLYVTEYYTGTVMAVNVAKKTIVDRWEGISNDNLARQLVVHPTREKVYVPHIRSRVTAVHGEGSIFPYVSVIDTSTAKSADDKRRRRIPMDAFLGALVTANPWECAISPNGEQFYVVFAGTNDMFACHVVDDDYREIKYRQHMQLGKNPRAVRVSPDSATVYVYNALDFNIVAYNTANLAKIGEVSVTTYPHSDELLLGKVLFYTALQPMASRRWISCSSCHPDGEPDGRTWHNPEGLRNTQSLSGMAWTHPIHWSADRDEVQDFEHTIRGKLMQGSGLLRGELNAELAKPNSGLSKSLDALAVYSNSHTHELSPFAKQGLTEAAKRGQVLFHAAETKCATCHSGPHYSDSQPQNKLLRHNVGTREHDPNEKMGPAFDTPTLLGVYRTAPYFHSGKAATLTDVLTTMNANDQHGKTSHLSAREISDLVSFLQALPFENIENASQKANLQKVVK